MPKIFIQGENAASVARAYVFGHNSTVAGSDARGIAATSNLSGSNRQRQAALVKAYDAATEPAAKQAALDGIAFYAFQQAVVTAQRSDNYEIERPADYAHYARQALASARGYAAEEARQAREAQTVRDRAAEKTRLANRTPQARALDDTFGEDTGRVRISAQSARGQAMAVLNQYFNTLPENVTGELRYNRARNAIDNELERVDTSIWNSSARENALRSARSILDRQQEIELEQAAARPPAAPANAPAGGVMHGTRNTRYGQSVSIAPDQARNTATVAILSGTYARGQHFNRVRVNEILGAIPVQEQYANAQLRELHNQQAAATDMGEKNSIQAVIAILTIENKFAAERAANRNNWKMFANNGEVMNFFNQSLTTAGTYLADDQTVGAAPTAGGGQGATSTATRSGLRVYGRKDGTPAPNLEEVPNLADEAQVRALQRSLGLTGAEVDGMYGPQTHTLMLAAAQRQNKPPREFDFTLAGAFEAFIAALTGQGQTAAAAAVPATGAGAATAPDLTTQLAPQLAAVAGLSDDVKDYRFPIIAPDDASVRDAFLANFLDPRTGASSLDAEQIQSIQVRNGVISSPFIGRVEAMLGMQRDNQMDLRLETALKDATVKSAVVAAFTGTTVRGGTTTDVASASGASAGGGQGAVRQ